MLTRCDSITSLMCLVVALGFAAALLPASSTAAADPQSYDDLDHPMLKDPDLTIPSPVRVFDDRLAQLWGDALLGPDADLRRRSAETMVAARRMGMEGLEITVPNLKNVATRSNEDAMVRFAALRALVAIDAHAEAPTVWQTALDLGSDAEADAVDALARWKFEPARVAWRERLNTTSTAHRELLLAIKGLAGMEDIQELSQFKKLVTDPFAAFDVRLAAARALAQLQHEGLENISSELLAPESPTRRDRIVAAAILRQHSGPATEDLLERLALDKEPTVANLALERLIEIAPARIASNQQPLLASRDANVRRWTVHALAKFPSAEHVVVLAPFTNDPNPGIRVLVRNTLATFAQEHNLREPVLQQAEKLLAQTDWRGIEQACRLVGTLDHKPAAQSLVDTLSNPRIEAHATAAWALRKIAVPETLPQVLTFAKATTTIAMREFQSGATSRDYDPLFTQIFQFFGAMKYQPADPLLRLYIPKLSMSTGARCSAIWALGYLNADNPPEDLVEALEARMLDVGVSLPEMEIVRAYSAVSLGRMKASAALPTLRRFYGEDGAYTPSGYGSGWAIEQIAGEPVEKPQPALDYVHGWFLLPIQ